MDLYGYGFMFLCNKIFIEIKKNLMLQLFNMLKKNFSGVI